MIVSYTEREWNWTLAYDVVVGLRHVVLCLLLLLLSVIVSLFLIVAPRHFDKLAFQILCTQQILQ